MFTIVNGVKGEGIESEVGGRYSKILALPFLPIRA